MATLPVLRSRLRGSLYGLVVGDALGGPYEFQSRGSYRVSADMIPSETFLNKGKPLPAGTWTDDTSLALCLAVSLNEHKGLEWHDFAKRMVDWFVNGYMSAIDRCFDIGNATRQVLDIYRVHLEHRKLEDMKIQGLKAPSTSGNGSLMRLAPVPVFYHSRPVDALENAALQSRVTHASDLAVESCLLATAQILGFFQEPDNASPSEKKSRVLAPDFMPEGVEELSFKAEPAVALRKGTWKDKSEEDIQTSGFVIHSHEAALWALWTTNSFEEGMMRLLAMGSDVDTVCAIYGQIAGACYGYDSIPQRWVAALQKPELLASVLDRLVDNSI